LKEWSRKFQKKKKGIEKGEKSSEREEIFISKSD
jgi:hypothetical protein